MPGPGFSAGECGRKRTVRSSRTNWVLPVIECLVLGGHGAAGGVFLPAVRSVAALTRVAAPSGRAAPDASAIRRLIVIDMT
jgi:hypothetical protein